MVVVGRLATRRAEVLGYANPHKTIDDHCTMVREMLTMVQTGLKADRTPAL